METITGARGCGYRVMGGIYLEVKLSKFGVPLHHFYIDPPVPIEPLSIGLSPVGIKMFQDGEGIWHVFDWIGSKHYPNVADIIEEIKHMGLSRRASTGTDFSKIGPGSKIVLLHARGYIEDPTPYYDEFPHNLTHFCHTGRHREDDIRDECCSGIWWNDVDIQEPVRGGAGGVEVLIGNDDLAIERYQPSFSYFARQRPRGLQPRYRPAMIAAFPLTNIAVINDPEGGRHEKATEKVSRSSIPWVIEDR